MVNTKDSLGDRMKSYEGKDEIPLMPNLPIIVRIDGKAFHTLTNHLRRPYDSAFSSIMQGVAVALARESNALLSYNQSDEISLLLYSNNPLSQIYFNGKRSKLISILASLATGFYNNLAHNLTRTGFFDCRVFQLPNEGEAVNYFIWRQQDAVRNSIQSATRSEFSHKECDGKNQSEMHEMLFSKGINWANYPDFFKNGTFHSRRYKDVMTTNDSINDLKLVTQRFYEQSCRNLKELTWSQKIDYIFTQAMPTDSVSQ